MGVQKEILTRTVTPVDPQKVVPNSDQAMAPQPLGGRVGTLAIGKPGDVVSRAFGPLTYAEVTKDEDAVEFGAFVADKGVCVNSNDVPNRTNFEENLVVKAGDTAAFMTYGTFVTTADKLPAINTGMNARIVYPAGTDIAAVVSDVNGKATAASAQEPTDQAKAAYAALKKVAYEVEVTGFKAS